jgi:quinol-cytochrome oxidoreductase complex cytochrome b subunit
MIEQLLEKMNENKFFIGVMMIIVTIGGRFIISELDENQKKMIHNQNFRRLFIFCAFFMATRDIICTIILTIIFILIVSELFSEEEDLFSSFVEKDPDDNPALENDKKIQSMIDDLNELKNKL